MTPIWVGIDIGSTTVKAVARRGSSPEIIWKDYQRHETRQGAKVREFLDRMRQDIGVGQANTRLFLTGSGAGSLAPMIGGRFVQEVNAVSMAVEKAHPDVQSVVELGGQDAKILFFQDQPGTSAKKKIATMNDKCAGGTGAVLDKLSAKLHIPPDRLCRQRYRGLPVHRVAGKCGVFAETDINGLQKLGIPSEELMASLFEAIVLQNLTVLTRGQVLCPKVLLLGGPNTFIPGLREAWQAHIPKMWAERGVEVPEGISVEDLIFCPEDGHYFAAFGALEFGYEQDSESGRYKGLDELDRYLEGGRRRAPRQPRHRRTPRFGRGTRSLHSRIHAEGFRGPHLHRHGRSGPRRRWRLHLHQGRAARRRRQGARQGLLPFEGQSDPGHHRPRRRSAATGGRRRRDPAGARRRNHRLCQERPRTDSARRHGPGRDRGPCPLGPAARCPTSMSSSMWAARTSS